MNYRYILFNKPLWQKEEGRRKKEEGRRKKKEEKTLLSLLDIILLIDISNNKKSNQLWYINYQLFPLLLTPYSLLPTPSFLEMSNELQIYFI
ncbi:hypothetical protein [Okeania sp. KiyG1]|uniref:hypothetical protein n=1 Tax=Okeania sp. KiyG1 TaxID=2720165 RepID=UPI001923C755|nr:hypothetical protein [Okeania sp. KiyG1]